MDFEKYIESLKTRIGDEKLFFDYQLEPPEVSSILRFQGTLRISWAFDMKYNKQIDLIFFPEDNPYINYAVLYAKDFKKTISNDEPYYKDKKLIALDIPFDINYEFVKEILLQSGLSQDTQERFFNSRFGSVFINMEVEFEWWSAQISFEYLDRKIVYPKHTKAGFSFLAYDSSILRAADDMEWISAIICLGTIKFHKILPQTTKLNFSPYLATWEFSGNIYHITHSEVLSPLPTSALALTYTNINDFIVNVRDKPNTKDGKIVTQLLTQKTRMPDDFLVDASKYDYNKVLMMDYDSNKALNPIYDEMVSLGSSWFKADKLGYGTDTIGHFLYYQHKSKQNYFDKHKTKLTNPLKDSDYIILVWNIEPNNWAKVWILKYQRSDKNISLEQDLAERQNNLLANLSKFKLYEGYIHCSGLRYIMPFGENYIKK